MRAFVAGWIALVPLALPARAAQEPEPLLPPGPHWVGFR
jgi:hypothetical protein